MVDRATVSGTATKKILLVDDEAPFLESLRDGLTAVGDFTIFTAHNGDDAVGLLAQGTMDAMVTDLKMPAMDGFSLIAYANTHCPQMPIVVMTAYGTPDIELYTKDLGAAYYQEKPLDFEELGRLLEDVTHAKKSTVHGISLFSFLQLMEMEKKTCSLRIGHSGKLGYIHVSRGELIDAYYAGIHGVAACKEMFFWNGPSIEVDRASPAVERTIFEPMSHVIMDTLRQFDEERHKRSTHVARQIQQTEEKPSHELKEVSMNVQKFHETVEKLKTGLGPGLLATDCYSASDGQSVSGFNSNPKACALFNQVTAYLKNALAGSGFPALRDYYILNLEGNKLVLVAPIGAFHLGMLVDSNQIQMGLLLNVVLPDVLQLLREAQG